MHCLRLTLSIGFLAAVACTPEDKVDFFQDLSRDPGYPGTAGDPASYQNLFAYAPVTAGCTPGVPRRLDAHTEVRAFRGNGISMDDVARYLGGLQRYYNYYGVAMSTRHDVISVPLDHAVVYNEAAIVDVMIKQGVNPDCANADPVTAACGRAVGASMLHNVKEFLRLYAEPRRDLINIVLLKRIVALNPSREMADTWAIAGLGLSEALLKSSSASDLGTSLGDILDEGNFSPTVFIGVYLTDFLMSEPDIVIAHEFGHAYGLEHIANNTSNLMAPEAVSCSQSLSQSQLSVIEKATAGNGNVLDASRYSALELLSLTHRAPEVMQIVRSRIAKQVRLNGDGL